VLQTYPLATLHEVRQRAVESAESFLARRTTECERAVQLATLATERLAVARVSMLAQAEQQLELARHGRATVHDLQIGDAYRLGAQREFDRLAVEEQRAKLNASQCRTLLEQAQHALVVARQELGIVERHRENFIANMRRADELRVDENAADVWQANQLKPTPAGLK